MTKMYMPCHDYECMEVIEFDSEDPYVRKYCNYHYIEVKKDLLKCGAKWEVW